MSDLGKGAAVTASALAAEARSLLASNADGTLFEVRVRDIALRQRLDVLLVEGDDLPISLLAQLHALASVAASLDGDGERQRALADEAARLAAQSNDPAAVAHAYAAQFDARAAPQLLGWRQVEADAFAQAAIRARDARLELLARRHRAALFWELGDLTAVRSEIRAFTELALVTGNRHGLWFAASLRAGLRLAEDRLDDAEADIAEAARLGREVRSENSVLLAEWVQRTQLLASRGRIHEALELFSAQFRERPEVTMGLDVGPIVLAHHGGVPDDRLRAAIDDLPLDLLSHLPVDGSWLFIVAVTGNALAAAGDGESALAAEVSARLQPFADHVVMDGSTAACLGPVSATLGRLAAAAGNADAATTWFTRALATTARWAARGVTNVIRRDLEALAMRDAGAATRPARLVVDQAAWLADGALSRITFAGVTVQLRTSKGLDDLRRLIASPETEIHALDLASVTTDRRSRGSGRVEQSGLEQLDPIARRSYERRIRDLQELIEDAEGDNDVERAAQAKTEQEWLLRELASALGLSGRPRTTGDSAERARKAVAMRIGDAIDKLADAHPALARHLRNSVRTGMLCVYRPEHEIEWTIDAAPR